MGVRGRLMCAFTLRAPAYGTRATRNILLIKRSECQAERLSSAKHAQARVALPELGFPAVRLSGAMTRRSSRRRHCISAEGAAGRCVPPRRRRELPGWLRRSRLRRRRAMRGWRQRDGGDCWSTAWPGGPAAACHCASCSLSAVRTMSGLPPRLVSDAACCIDAFASRNSSMKLARLRAVDALARASSRERGGRVP